MKTPSTHRPRGARFAALAASLVLATSAQAQVGSSDAHVTPAAASKQAREIAHGDPTRWHQEDATDKQRMRTRQKEIGAALAEAKAACRGAPATERAACLKAAQDTYKEEMSTLRSEAAAQPAQPAR